TISLAGRNSGDLNCVAATVAWRGGRIPELGKAIRGEESAAGEHHKDAKLTQQLDPSRWLLSGCHFSEVQPRSFGRRRMAYLVAEFARFRSPCPLKSYDFSHIDNSDSRGNL